ncbi:MAG: ATP-binding protein [Desulfobacterales bacterium]|nr:ATP-binding protein [Desulfobacterales bacterium]
MRFEFDIAEGDFNKAGTASSKVKQILKELGVPLNLIKRTTVAMYEAEINVVAHAHGGGRLVVSVDLNQVRVEVTDHGPGIQNIAMAMEEGFSTASPKVVSMGFGSGMGLPNIRRNADDLNISSTTSGTKVTITNYI